MLISKSLVYLKMKDINDLYLEDRQMFPERISQIIKEAKPFLTSKIENQNGPIPVIDFINTRLPDRDDLIGGGILVKGGITVVGGEAKIGKSLFVAQMAICLATGANLLSKFPCAESKVLLVQQEIHAKSMKKRLKLQLNGKDIVKLNENLFVVNATGIKLDTDDGIKQLEKYINLVCPDVLALDPLYKFHNHEENSNAEMRDVFDRVDCLKADHDLSIVIVHHHGKPSEYKRSSGQLLRGASVIRDYGNTNIALTNKGRGSDGRKLINVAFEMRDSEEPSDLVICRNTNLLYDLDSSYKPTKVTETDILAGYEEVKDSDGWAFRKELVDAVMEIAKASKKTVETILKEVEKKLFKIEERKGRGSPIYYKKEKQII